ncbi:hypothetical protein [Pseudaminobacter soli (ex Li et al. 2025)]|uniref:TnsA endonuclease N-terminal domain-containing protein n=1 Tax=Pseudaminobacter soli (ex Li et al. 2025) TaxID=1295366 RepID=A0A2P7SD35_9HYPH|nr:hypothetical protein [Mesorhizobium soli]PSJ60400.1 hypothetical protein C7I85_14765 [Mesorhizobium soli]
MGIAQRAMTLRASRKLASTFYPSAAIKCIGLRRYRSQSARDVACLLDVNPSITAWKCMPTAFDCAGQPHVPDFEIFNVEGGSTFVDAPDRRGASYAPTVEAAVKANNGRYHPLANEEVYSGYRLRNAKDLLRYGDHITPLGDRLRLLAGLDEHGSLPFSECLAAFQETRAVAGMASLILHGFIEVDLDEAPIGPETLVRRIPR